MKNSCVEDQSGSALILLLVISAVIATAGLYLSMNVATGVKLSKRPLQHQILEYVRDEAYFYLTDELSWQATANQTTVNTQLSCVGDPAVVCSPGEYDLVFYNIEEKVVLGGSGQGFTNRGEPCGTFSGSGVGDSNCPMRYKVTWRPVCPPIGSCDTSTIEVKAVMEVNDPGNNDVKSLNLRKYNIVLYRQYPP